VVGQWEAPGSDKRRVGDDDRPPGDDMSTDTAYRHDGRGAMTSRAVRPQVRMRPYTEIKSAHKTNC
jgi:hypothetical protein